MPEVYLTIDDSPSSRTRDYVDFLKDLDIPAILFVRGALMEKNPAPIEYAIKNGLAIGNHSYAHIPAGDMEPQDWATDLELCDHLIEAAYARCDIRRPGKYYRFPYVDRGDGERVERAFAGGSGDAIIENDKTKVLQNYLHEQGFAQPFKNMAPHYPNGACDCLFTYTSADWMLTARHKEKHAYKTLDDLKRKIDEDAGLNDLAHPSVVIMHDQAEIFEESCALIKYMHEKGFTFLDFE